VVRGLVRVHAEVIEAQLNGSNDRSGEAVLDHVGFAGDVLDARGVLGYVRELALLAGGPRFGHFGHAECEWLVVHKCCKLMALQQEPEVANRQPEAKEFSVERTVFALPGG